MKFRGVSTLYAIVLFVVLVHCDCYFVPLYSKSGFFQPRNTFQHKETLIMTRESVGDSKSHNLDKDFLIILSRVCLPSTKTVAL